MPLSHGFINNLIDIPKINSIKSECLKFLKTKKYEENYIKNIDFHIAGTNDLITDNVLLKVKSLIREKFSLKVTELHLQYPGCKSIPPHQDNFYHCVSFDKTLKILVPLQKLNPNNGGLIYADVDYSYPILEHIPSKISGFSSFIENIEYFSKSFNETKYFYELGDCSYHFGNSIHRSNGNKTKDLSMFLVYRFESNFSIIDKNLQKKYETCYLKHQNLINENL